MNIWDIQAYVKGRIEAHPQFLAKGVVAILDDGTYPKIAGLEDTLRKKGLAIVVWRIGSLGLIDTAKTGVSNQLLHVAVVIQEVVKTNRGAASTGITPTGIFAEQAYQYVAESISGYPKGTPPGTPIVPNHEPFSNLGSVNGALTIVANFTKEHRITPL